MDDLRRHSTCRVASTRLTLLTVTWMVLIAACGRSSQLWSGVEFQSDGTLKLAAEEPLCGCLSVMNVSDANVWLHAKLDGREIGNATLRPNERQQFRFDGAGAATNQAYILEATSPQGQHLDGREVLQLDSRPRFAECDGMACETAGLMMNAAESEP